MAITLVAAGGLLPIALIRRGRRLALTLVLCRRGLPPLRGLPARCLGAAGTGTAPTGTGTAGTCTAPTGTGATSPKSATKATTSRKSASTAAAPSTEASEASRGRGTLLGETTPAAPSTSSAATSTPTAATTRLRQRVHAGSQ